MKKTAEDGDKSRKELRRQRLAEQLRANLQRRKRQARARRSGEADERPAGIEPSGRGEGE